jgi:antitoxin component YwqK of YwqJK toxin-antitoxin module
LQQQTKIFDQLIDGEIKQYYENGNIKIVGFNINNIQEKIWEYYDTKGVLYAKREYKNGKMIKEIKN